MVESIEGFIPGSRRSAAEDLRRIADNLAPVPAELRELGAQLQSTADELAAIDPTLAELETTVGNIADHLASLEPTVDELAATADRLAERVDDAKGRVRIDVWLARLAVVLIGVILAIGLLLAARRPREPGPSVS